MSLQFAFSRLPVGDVEPASFTSHSKLREGWMFHHGLLNQRALQYGSCLPTVVSLAQEKSRDDSGGRPGPAPLPLPVSWRDTLTHRGQLSGRGQHIASCEVTILGDIQNLTGHGLGQPAVGGPPCSSRGLDWMTSKGSFPPQPLRDSVEFFVYIHIRMTTHSVLLFSWRRKIPGYTWASGEPVKQPAQLLGK